MEFQSKFKPKKIYPEQVEYLKSLSIDTYWTFKHKSARHRRNGKTGKSRRYYDCHISINKTQQWVYVRKIDGSEYTDIGCLIYHFGGVEVFLKTKCIKTKMSFEEWKEFKLNPPKPKRKRERIKATKIKY